MAETDRERLRETFTNVAELYDRVRPGYPRRMFDDLAEAAGLGPGSRVLELGCGTGQATVPLAERGCEIIAVELGTDMSWLARRNLARFPQVEIVNAAFEDWPLPKPPFDAVVAATAFHWIDPAVRVAKSADALRPGGVLATVTTHHVAAGPGGSDDFFAAVQACYERFDPSTPPNLRLRPSAEIPTDAAEIEASDRFGPPTFHRYEWGHTYSRTSYLDLLCTYSGHLAMPPKARNGLLHCIGTLIDRSGGHITKHYLTELRTAHRI